MIIDLIREALSHEFILLKLLIQLLTQCVNNLDLDHTNLTKNHRIFGGFIILCWPGFNLIRASFSLISAIELPRLQQRFHKVPRRP